ncbi:MAG: hypothetical protein ACQETL_19335, partial [Bacteroidota bacterium]
MKISSMGKYLLSLSISFLFLVSSQQSLAQCPTVAGTTINTCDFSTGGEITIIFTDGDPSEHENYILYDTDGPTAVSEPFGSVTKTYDAVTQTLVYGNIPDGTYLAGNSGCPTLGGFGIEIDQTNELILSVNNIINDCDNLGSGEIDLDVSGGDSPYSYAWSDGLPDQQDQTGLSAGTYDVTVTDDDNCTFTLTGIVVDDGPVIHDLTNTDPTEVCDGQDLTISLDGSDTDVDYEVLINGGGSGTIAAGTGNALDITLASGDFVDGDDITVRADDGNCPTVIMNGNFVVNVTDAPTAEAGDDATVCEGDDLDLSASGTVNATNFSSLSWSSSGDGTFDDNTILEPVYTPGANDIANESVVLTLQANGNGVCDSVTDNMTLTITPAPTAEAGDDATVCEGDDLDLSASGTV